MSQPRWKRYKNLGDIGHVDVDESGVYPPEAEIVQEYDDDGKTRFQVYRFPLDKLICKGGEVVNEYGHKEWFSDDLDAVARSTGGTASALAKGFCSNDIMKRFNSYYDVGSHFGFDNLDSDPLNLSELELGKRGRGPTARRLHTRHYGYSAPGSRKRRR